MKWVVYFNKKKMQINGMNIIRDVGREGNERAI